MTTHIITRTNVNNLRQTYSLKDSFSVTEAKFIEDGRASGATVKFSPDGETIASLSFDTSLHVFELGKRKKIYSQYATRPTFLGLNRTISFHPYESVVIADYDADVSLVDYTSGQVRTVAKATTGNDDWSHIFTTDGLFWTCQQSGGEIAVYEFSTSTQLHVFRGHTSIICGLLFSPNNRLLATAGHYISSGRIDETVRLWDIQTGQQHHVLKSETESMPMTMAFSPSGEVLAVSYFVGEIGEVYLFNVSSGQKTQVLQGHTRPVNQIAFSKNGKQLATASWDSSIRLWNTETGQEIHRWNQQENLNMLFVGLNFNRDEALLISGMREEGMVFLDPVSGEIISKLRIPDLLHFDISPNGKALAIGTWDSVQIWQVQDS